MFRIPFERALEFANNEKITDLLYPLFVHNIGGLLYHPTNQTRTNMVVQESQQRRLEGPQVARTPGSQPPALHHHHSLHTPVPSHLAQPPHSMGSQPGRPALDRAHTFPTPPASASSLMGVTNQGSSYEWGNQGMGPSVQSSQPLSIDTTLNNARSMPTTPATTPPGSNIQGMQFQGGHYDNTKPYYSAAPPSHAQYAPQPMTGYGQNLPSTAYLKSDMGPPSARAPGDSEAGDAAAKSDRYAPNSAPATGEPVPEQESEYVQDSGAGYNHRGSYTYTTNSSVNTLTGEHPQLTPELSSPSQQNGSGRMTPRTGGGPPPQWASGYNTPPRSVATSSLYNIVSDTRGTPANGAPPSDSYSVSNSAPAYSTGMNGSMPTGTKRMREDDEIIRPDSRGTEYDGKRRKTITEMNGPLAGPPLGMQPMKAGGVMPRRR